MIEINTEIVGGDFFKRKLSALYGKDAAKAVNRAINHTLATVNTRLNREIRNIYNISLSDVNDKDNKLIKKSSESTLTGEIKASIQPVSLSKFNPKFTKGNSTFSKLTKKGGFAGSRKFGPLMAKEHAKLKADSGVTIEIVKGQKSTIKSAFLLFRGGSSSAPVMARGRYSEEGFQFGKPRLPISKLNSKSVFFMIFNDRTERAIANKINTDYPARLIHEIQQGLNFNNR